MTSSLDDVRRALGEPGGAGRALAALRAALRADRVSFGAIDAPGGAFEILATAGESLLAPGTRLPAAASTHYSLASDGTSFVSPDFDRWNGFDLPVDRLIRLHGFRAGAGLPVCERGRRGVLSIHFRRSNPDTISAIPDLLPLLGALATTFLGSRAAAPVSLTPREYEVLVGLDEGLRVKQVARALGISEATVKAHSRNLFRKLGATSRAEATRAARSLGLLHA